MNQFNKKESNSVDMVLGVGVILSKNVCFWVLKN